MEASFSSVLPVSPAQRRPRDWRRVFQVPRLRRLNMEQFSRLRRLNISVEAFALHDSVDFATRVRFLQCLSFVMEFLSLAKRDHAFRFPTFRKVNTQRNHREATLLGSPNKSEQFVFIQKQFANAFGRMVPNGGLSILFDFTANQPKFTIFDASVRLFDRAFPIAQALHLTAVQNNSAFNLI